MLIRKFFIKQKIYLQSLNPLINKHLFMNSIKVYNTYVLSKWESCANFYLTKLVPGAEECGNDPSSSQINNNQAHATFSSHLKDEIDCVKSEIFHPSYDVLPCFRYLFTSLASGGRSKANNCCIKEFIIFKISRTITYIILDIVEEFMCMLEIAGPRCFKYFHVIMH